MFRSLFGVIRITLCCVGLMMIATIAQANDANCVCKNAIGASCFGTFSSTAFIICDDLNGRQGFTDCAPGIGQPNTGMCEGNLNVDTWSAASPSTEPATSLGGTDTGAPAGGGTVEVQLLNPLGVISVPGIIGRIVAWFGTAAGALFMLYLLWGGVEWMTAQGNEERAKAGMNRIIAAASGIAVILLAYMIVATVIGVIPK